MQMISSRTIPFLDVQSLAPCNAFEALFRDETSFILYVSDDAPPPARQEIIIRLETREALVWLHETAQEAPSSWI